MTKICNLGLFGNFYGIKAFHWCKKLFHEDEKHTQGRGWWTDAIGTEEEVLSYNSFCCLNLKIQQEKNFQYLQVPRRTSTSTEMGGAQGGGAQALRVCNVSFLGNRKTLLYFSKKIQSFIKKKLSQGSTLKESSLKVTAEWLQLPPSLFSKNVVPVKFIVRNWKKFKLNPTMVRRVSCFSLDDCCFCATNPARDDVHRIIDGGVHDCPNNNGRNQGWHHTSSLVIEL